MPVQAATHPVAVTPDPVLLRLGQYQARIGTSPDLRHKALRLRAGSFRNGMDDEDRFDADSLHGLVESEQEKVRVAFRARLIPSASALAKTYTGHFYDLTHLGYQSGPFLELGRFCQSRDAPDITALRLAWAALGALVDAHGVSMIIGCSSFPGADPDRHQPVLSTLRANHLGPVTLRPGRKASKTFDLPKADIGNGLLPHLLRSYLNMGGWVSDHAVIDPELDTLHVFTGLVVQDIPQARKRRLRDLADAARIGPLDLACAAP